MISPTGHDDLTPAEQERYARHLLLPEVGLEGQKRLKASSVLCVGWLASAPLSGCGWRGSYRNRGW